MDGHGDILGPQHAVLVDQLDLLLRRKVRVLEVCAGESGLDQPDLDIFLRDFLAEGLGEALDAGLGGDIDRAAGHAADPAHRADQHDIARPLKSISRLPRGGEVGREIGGDGIAHVVVAHLGQGVRRDGGVDHGDIQPAEVGVGLAVEAFDIVGLGEIEGDAITLPHLPDPLQRIREVVRIAAADEDLHAVGREQDRDGPADAGGPTGDDGAASGQGGSRGVGVGFRGHGALKARTRRGAGIGKGVATNPPNRRLFPRRRSAR